MFSIGIGGSNQRQITRETEDIATAVVSGNGLVAYAVTPSSRLLRIDIASGATTELIAETPLISAAYPVYRPETTVAPIGSVIDLYGSGFDSVQQASFCGHPASIMDGRIRFQVPWDLPEGPCQAVVSSDSRLEHGIELQVRRYDPQFILNGLLFHRDFSRISQENPARSGEPVVTYMTGLGPVDANRLIEAGFECKLNGIPAEVLYAGLAPEFTGFYQVNIRLPDATVIAGSSSLSCGWDSTRQATTSTWTTR